MASALDALASAAVTVAAPRKRRRTTPTTRAPWFRRPTLLWLRPHALRTRDNPAFCAALQRNTPLIVLFVLPFAPPVPSPPSSSSSSSSSAPTHPPTKESSPNDTIPSLPSRDGSPDSTTPPVKISDIFASPVIDVARIGRGRADLPYLATHPSPSTPQQSSPPPVDPIIRVWTLCPDSVFHSRAVSPDSTAVPTDSDSSTLASIWNIRPPQAVPQLPPAAAAAPAAAARELVNEVEAMDSDVPAAYTQWLYNALRGVEAEVRALGGELVTVRTTGTEAEEVVRIAEEVEAEVVYWMKDESSTACCDANAVHQSLSKLDIQSKEFEEDQIVPEMPHGPMRCFAALVGAKKKFALDFLKQKQLAHPRVTGVAAPIGVPEAMQQLETGTLSRSAAWEAAETDKELRAALEAANFTRSYEKSKLQYGYDANNLALEFCPPGRSTLQMRWNARQWNLGSTGYPLVDAAIRTLRREGQLPLFLQGLLLHFICFCLEVGFPSASREIQSLLICPGSMPREFLNDLLIGTWPPKSRKKRFGSAHANLLRHSARELVKQAVPELQHLPDRYILCPWLAPQQVRSAARLTLLTADDMTAFLPDLRTSKPLVRGGQNFYPNPCVPVSAGRSIVRRRGVFLNRVALSFKVPIHIFVNEEGPTWDSARPPGVSQPEEQVCVAEVVAEPPSPCSTVDDEESEVRGMSDHGTCGPRTIAERQRVVKAYAAGQAAERDKKKSQVYECIALHLGRLYDFTHDTERETSTNYLRVCAIRDEIRNSESGSRKITINHLKEFLRDKLGLEVTGEWDRHYHGGVRGPWVYGMKQRRAL